LEDAENVLHVRSGKIARVDRDVFAAVADWDLDQSKNCIITLISLLLLLSRHDRKFPQESSIALARKCARNSDEKLRESKKEEKKTTKAKVV